MTTREPPNLRPVECCANCKHYDSVICFCLEYQTSSKMYDGTVCDDYSPEGEVETK
jgi:hypothetical protein